MKQYSPIYKEPTPLSHSQAAKRKRFLVFMVVTILLTLAGAVLGRGITASASTPRQQVVITPPRDNSRQELLTERAGSPDLTNEAGKTGYDSAETVSAGAILSPGEVSAENDQAPSSTTQPVGPVRLKPQARLALLLIIVAGVLSLVLLVVAWLALRHLGVIGGRIIR